MKKAIIMILLVLLLGGGVGGYFYWYYLPINRIERAFAQEDYDTVVEYYGELSDAQDKKDVQEELAAVAKDYYQQYYKEKVSYNTAMDFFDLTGKILKKHTQAMEYRANIQEIYQSRKTYGNGISYMNKEQYLNAIACFEAVSNLDEEYRKNADANIRTCKEAYCDKAIEQAQAHILSEAYYDARDVLEEALTYFPDEARLLDLLAEVREMIDALEAVVDIVIDGDYVVTYNVGDLVAKELGVTNYKVIFPVKMTYSFRDGHLSISVVKSSIKPALDALTSDNDSMEAIYAVAKSYGINKTAADILIKMTYGGSYSDFIMDYFGGDIDEALKDFSLETIYCVDETAIYLGTEEPGGDDYFTYAGTDSGLRLEEYMGFDSMLSLLEYPIELDEK